jgi:hypothetical protein
VLEEWAGELALARPRLYRSYRPLKPVGHPPGSVEKCRAMRERYLLRLDLFHPRDYVEHVVRVKGGAP